MTSVEIKCKYCGEYQFVERDKLFEPHECVKCHQIIETPKMQQVIAKPGTTLMVLSDRTRVGKKLSSEFRTGVLDKIMSVKGAANSNRKYG